MQAMILGAAGQAGLKGGLRLARTNIGLSFLLQWQAGSDTLNRLSQCAGSDRCGEVRRIGRAVAQQPVSTNKCWSDTEVNYSI